MDEVLPVAAVTELAEAGAAAPPKPLLRERLGRRSVVLVGLMGAGKSTVGRRLAVHLGMPFRDADTEIEAAAGMPISDIFAELGEAAFRDGERRVIHRLLGQEPLVLATGGGAYMSQETRARIHDTAICVWLRADHATLLRRVSRRSNRPLLKTGNPAETLRRLMAERYPVYELAHLTVEARDGSHQAVVHEVARSLAAWLDAADPT